MLKTNPHLKHKWLSELHSHFPQLDLETLQILYDHHAVSNRRYHGVKHLGELMNLHLYGRGYGVTIPEFKGPKYSQDIALAIMSHDSIYRMTKTDVQDSAECYMYLTDSGPDDIVVGCIMATESHIHGDSDIESYMIDLDMTALAAPWEVFYSNTLDLRDEAALLGGYDTDMWNEGRKKFTQSVLETDRIFATPEFIHLEGKARANLESSLSLVF